MHSVTNRYAKNMADSLVRVLQNLAISGEISNELVACGIDRYYHYSKGVNYYYKFFDRNLPIYDAENLDKRRKEIGLSPLYLFYKNNNHLDRLPKEYKYDINTIEKW